MYKFAAKDHNNSVTPIVEALLSLGYKPTATDPDFILLDHDAPQFYQNIIDQYPNAKVIVYQHGEPYMFAWDGIWEPNPQTAGYLTSNDGCKEVMERYGYPNPIYTIGWHRSQQREFRPAPSDRLNVTFAPIHPLNNGYLNPFHKAANIKAYQALLEMPISLTVRYIGDLGTNGLWIDNRTRYTNGRMDNSLNRTDLVVSNIGTYFSLSVANGFPCVAFGQDYAQLDGYDDQSLVHAKSWGEYEEYLRYPYDISDGCDALLAASKTEATEWRNRFIGDAMDIDKLDAAIKEIMNA